ncbi:ABC transporter permease subunit [Neobacillus sp. SuZ13]|uniref:ABC transporter permease subunit n=1 Tax=Neobacillus sp. SuZ13 TaxID=3047875 RepID=UPI0032DF33BE
MWTALKFFSKISWNVSIYSCNHRIYNSIKTLFEQFSVVPQTIIAYFILYSVLWMPLDVFHTPFWKRALFETFILVMIAIPNLSLQVANEMRLIEKESFIEASRTLGAGKTRIFFKHIVPHVCEKSILLFGQQFIQCLQLLAHLGFMKLFLEEHIIRIKIHRHGRFLMNGLV